MIFLDIDGVLAPIREWDRYGDLDRTCIQRLNEIVERGGADVVVSSTWRHGKTVAELQDMLDAEGFVGCVRDKTPNGMRGASRSEEIAAWLAEHDVGGYGSSMITRTWASSGRISFRRIRPMDFNLLTCRERSRCS